MNQDLVVGVVGAGAMGGGIAQVAAAAGHPVLLYDARPGAVAEARERIAAGLSRRVEDGKLQASERDTTIIRLKAAGELADLSACGMVIEAIVEMLEPKRALFAQLEKVVPADTILVTNTSSLSVAAIGRDLKKRDRFAGLHFFNPVPVMKLVEIVSGIDTPPSLAERLSTIVRAWGKAPVAVRSTPGFIVNRVARPFYAEALWLLNERRAAPSQIDAVLRAAGFRMGACELMDLIGHDVNYAVTESMFAANYGDRRFLPSPIQRELVEAGRLGQKSGQGFYRHPRAEAASEAPPETSELPYLYATVRGTHPLTRPVSETLWKAGLRVDIQYSGSGLELDLGTPADKAIRLCLTDGRPAAQIASESGETAVGVFDLPAGGLSGPLAIAFSTGCAQKVRARTLLTLRNLGVQPELIDDVPGLVVARTLAMLVNEAADTVLQGVASEKDVDLAMKLGTNYPQGPFEWLERFSAPYFESVLLNLSQLVCAERYRISPWLRQRVWSAEAAA